MNDASTNPSGTRCSAEHIANLEFILSESVRALTHQDRVLGEIRARSMTILAALTASAGLFASSVNISNVPSSAGFISFLGLATFALFGVLVVNIVRPTPKSWNVQVDGDWMRDQPYIADRCKFLDEMCGYYEAARQENKTVLDKRQQSMMGVVIVSAITFTLWAMAFGIAIA